MKLKNKTAVVTGGASGIGKAIAKLFLREGADVFIIDTNIDELERVVEEADQPPRNIHGLVCDVSDQKAVTDTFSGIHKTIDILVNNAGVSHVGNIQKTTEEDFDRIFRINVKGVYNCSKIVVDRMVKQGGGIILNMASIVSHTGIPDRFAYSMSKGAVLTMTYSIACDYLKYNIRCNCIAPARIHTPFVDGFLSTNYPGREKEIFEKLSKAQPVGRMGTPDEVAYLALYLCSDEASFITGVSFPIDGGFIYLRP
jgi:2-keto-3-deoxy-L-fuconate dehydrogenase